MNQINITCEELVSLPCGLKLAQHIMFNPTKESINAIKEAVHKGGWHTIHVKDNGGNHVTERDHRILSCRQVRNVVIFTSSEG